MSGGAQAESYDYQMGCLACTYSARGCRDCGKEAYQLYRPQTQEWRRQIASAQGRKLRRTALIEHANSLCGEHPKLYLTHISMNLISQGCKWQDYPDAEYMRAAFKRHGIEPLGETEEEQGDAEGAEGGAGDFEALPGEISDYSAEKQAKRDEEHSDEVEQAGEEQAGDGDDDEDDDEEEDGWENVTKVEEEEEEQVEEQVEEKEDLRSAYQKSSAKGGRAGIYKGKGARAGRDGGANMGGAKKGGAKKRKGKAPAEEEEDEDEDVEDEQPERLQPEAVKAKGKNWYRARRRLKKRGAGFITYDIKTKHLKVLAAKELEGRLPPLVEPRQSGPFVQVGVCDTHTHTLTRIHHIMLHDPIITRNVYYTMHYI